MKASVSSEAASSQDHPPTCCLLPGGTVNAENNRQMFSRIQPCSVQRAQSSPRSCDQPLARSGVLMIDPQVL